MTRALTVSALVLLAAFTASCSSTTTVTTFPASFEVLVDGKIFGPSPARVTLPNRTFGEYALVIRDEEGRELYKDILPMESRFWSIFVPLGYFMLAPAYDIDVSVRSRLEGREVCHPTEERGYPPVRSPNAAANLFADFGFAFLDKGWLHLARYWLDLAHDVDANYPDAILGLAIYHRQKGELDEARRMLELHRAASRQK